MSRWLLTPVKPLVEAKSRLSPLLTAEERGDLTRCLLERTLLLAQQSARFTAFWLFRATRTYGRSHKLPARLPCRKQARPSMAPCCKAQAMPASRGPAAS